MLHAAYPDNLLQRIAEEAMHERGLLTYPPDAVLREVATLTAAPAQADADTRDLRAWPFTSIDNPESRDLDQIELCEPAAGGTLLRVGIADVDRFVPAGSETDRFAAHNTTSVYTGARTFPMLPEALSYDRTSLLDERPRLALIIETLVHPDGTLGSGQVYQALVKNHAKLDYPSVSAWLAGQAPLPAALRDQPVLEEQLRQQDALAQRLSAARARAGALDFDTGEAREVMDCQGHVIDLAPHHPGRASRVIEELMIASNRTVAHLLDQAQLPSLRRVVKQPERWARIVAYAAERDYALPLAPSSPELSRFLVSMRQSRPREEFAEISVALVKLMGRGEYAAHEPGRPDVGHFGLATNHYTHATAPNRRYPDLIIQRLLRSLITRRPAPYAVAELAQLAQRCSQREADAQKIERRVRKSLAAQLLQARIGQRFSGLVTGASPKGTWARLLSPAVEGRIVAGEVGLRVGDRVQLRLRAVSVERGFIDLVAD